MFSRLDAARHLDEGFTLIEVMLTIALVSIAFVAILSAVASMITIGGRGSQASVAETSIRNLGQYIENQPYQRCDVAGGPIAAYQALIPGAGLSDAFDATVIDVKSWNGDSPATGTSGSCPTNPPCPASTHGFAAKDCGIEFVTLRVRSKFAYTDGSYAATRILTVTSRCQVDRDPNKC